MKKADFDLFAKYVTIHNLTVADGGVYFVKKSTDMKKDAYKLALCHLSGGDARELCEVGALSFWRVPSGIVYVEKHKPKKPSHFPATRLRLRDKDGDRPFCELPYAVGSICFLSEERFFFTASENLFYNAVLEKHGGDMKKAEKELSKEDDYLVFDELPFWTNGEGVVNKTRNHLFFYDEGAITKLTADTASVGSLCLSPDGRMLVYTISDYETAAPLYNRLMLLTVNSLASADISFLEQAAYSHACFVSDGKLAVLASEGKRFGLCENDTLYLCDPVRGQSGVIDDSGDDCFYNSVNTDIGAARTIGGELVFDGRNLYCLTTRDDSSHIAKISLGGDVSLLNAERGIVSEFIMDGEDFYAVAYRGVNGPEIYRMDRLGAEERQSSLNTAVGERYRLTEPARVSFRNENGDEINGFILKSHRSNPTRRTVLSVHGGPKTAFGGNIFCEMQTLAAKGYTVIYCNPTGSDGRGNRFADIRGGYGETDYRDLMRFCEVAAARSKTVSLNNMAVIGGSYGGYMVNHMISATDRFKAAVSQRSISNWSSFIGVSDIGPQFGADQVGATPWSDMQKVWDMSPLKNADKVGTPTLFIHSREDYRCPEAEGISMYTALAMHGVPTRLCLFKGENHELSRSGKPSHRIRRLSEITAWLDKYLD